MLACWHANMLAPPILMNGTTCTVKTNGIIRNAHDIYVNRFPTPNYATTSKNCEPRIGKAFSNGTSGPEVTFFHTEQEDVNLMERWTADRANSDGRKHFPPAAELFSNTADWFDITGAEEDSRPEGKWAGITRLSIRGDGTAHSVYTSSLQ